MNDEMVDVTKLMNEVISNLDILLDLKNIQIIKKDFVYLRRNLTLFRGTI